MINVWKSGQDENHIFRVKSKIGKIRKGVGYLSGFQGQCKATKTKKARYAIGNVSEKDLSKIIREFDKFDQLPYEKKSTKHEPTDSYVYLARQLAECMMRSDTLNSHDYGGYTKMTALSSNVYSTDEDK